LLRRLRERLRDEQGMAIVVAMILSMVVVTLGVTSVGLAIHNSEQSSYDRRHVQSIHAAEAGINYYFSHLQSGGVSEFQCSVSQTLPSTPPASFDATLALYDSAGLPLPCPLTGVEPDSALIRSVGRSTTASPARTMEAYVKLVPLPGGPFGEFAIFSDAQPQFNSNVQVYGGEAVEGNVYSNANVMIQSNSTIYGSIEAQGSVLLASNAEVKRSVLAGSSVQLKTNARVLQHVTSAGSSVSLDSNAHVLQDARAASTVTLLGNATVDGLLLPSSPAEPPEYRPFPELVFDPAAWQETGYTVQTFTTCQEAKAFIAGIGSGNHAVRITAPCDLAYSSGESVTLRGNLALIGNGSLTMSSNTGFVNDGTQRNLFLLFGMGGGSTPCDISFSSNTVIGPGLKTVLYTPCRIDMRSNTMVIEGQMFGGSVEFNSNASLTYHPIGVPGFGETTYDEDVLYTREVVTL
jgi:cytoskeletal protein CcmA (bactofilin family)/Tfp pilus assembly protein PilX